MSFDLLDIPGLGEFAGLLLLSLQDIACRIVVVDNMLDNLILSIVLVVLVALVTGLLHTDDPYRTADGPILRESERFEKPRASFPTSSP